MKLCNRVSGAEARAAERSSAQWPEAEGREATERVGWAAAVPAFRFAIKFAVASCVTVAVQRFACVKTLTPSPEAEGSLFSPRQHGRCRAFGHGRPRGRSTRRAAADSRESPRLGCRVVVLDSEGASEQERTERAGGRRAWMPVGKLGGEPPTKIVATI